MAGRPEYIVSLSSIPPRFSSLGETLVSLRDQSCPPQRIILYLPVKYRRFPDFEGSPPSVPDGVDVRIIPEDFGPASKILPAVREFADVASGRLEILFADDDLVYERDWAERLLSGRRTMPDAAICAHGRNLEDLGFPRPMGGHAVPRAKRLPRWQDLGYTARKLKQQIALGRAHLERHEKPHRTHFQRSGHIDIFEGFAGVLVQPRFFDAAVFDIPDILWTVDDVWLSGMVTARQIPIWLQADATRYRYTPARHAHALNQSVIEGADRDRANALCVRYFQKTYGIWN